MQSIALFDNSFISDARTMSVLVLIFSPSRFNVSVNGSLRKSENEEIEKEKEGWRLARRP